MEIRGGKRCDKCIFEGVSRSYENICMTESLIAEIYDDQRGDVSSGVHSEELRDMKRYEWNLDVI